MNLAWRSVLIGLAMVWVRGAEAQPSPRLPDVAYVLMDEGGGEAARLLTSAPACPSILIDGASRPMSERAVPSIMPFRPTASPPALSKPSDFPRRLCEAVFGREVRSVRIEARVLPSAPRDIRRIVVIGDTGRRLKAVDEAYQACNDPRPYPFAQIAASAARLHPDLVVHVGDYLYRENSCPADDTGCAGSPWGCGGDAWQADLFTPAAPLLAAAPWVFVRGNHETCVRAGQGWARFLSPWPLTAASDCADPARDMRGDFTAPYAVDLGGGVRLIAYDTADTSATPLAADDPRAIAYARTLTGIDALAKGAGHVFLADHHPLLAFAAKKPRPG